MSVIAGCVSPLTPAPCDAGDISQIREVLYFGLRRQGGEVSEGEWTRFVEEVITSSFPAGMTIVSGTGQ